MKNIRLLAFVFGLLLLCPIQLSAQFCNRAKGTIINYKYENFEENKKSTNSYRIADVYNEDGNLFVQMDMPVDTTVADIPIGNITGTQYIYDKTGMAKVVLISGEGMKKQIMGITAAVLENEKEKISEEELNSMIESEGEIAIDLRWDAKKGDKIPDCKITTKMMVVKYTVTLRDGLYEGNEMVSTPLGDFDCIKVSYKIKMSCMANSVSTSYMTEWYSPQHGLIKSETRDKKGKLLSSSILDTVECPR